MVAPRPPTAVPAWMVYDWGLGDKNSVSRDSKNQRTKTHLKKSQSWFRTMRLLWTRRSASSGPRPIEGPERTVKDSQQATSEN